MESVGYDMYLKLLSEAVNEENGTPPEDDLPCTVDLNVSAHIPESYIESLPARLGIYKRIAAVKNDDDASDVIDELCDRFGEPPESVMGLIDIALLRSKAAEAKIAEITGTSNTALLHINSIQPEVMSRLSAYFGKRFSDEFAADVALRFHEKSIISRPVFDGAALYLRHVDAVFRNDLQQGEKTSRAMRANGGKEELIAVSGHGSLPCPFSRAKIA